MTRHMGWPRGLAGVLATALIGSSGCLNCLHPVDPPAQEVVSSCGALPRACRNHVYVVLIHGLDPFDSANLAGVREYVHALGFIKTYEGQVYHASYFASEIRRLHAEDPDAHFVVMGFGYGAVTARDVADGVRADGAPIDLLIYCGGAGLANTPANRPENAVRVVHILGDGADSAGVPLDGADNVKYPNVSHFGSPAHPQTLELLARELAIVASNVPATEPGVAAPPPPPRPSGALEPPRDEWDFLKPAPVVTGGPSTHRDLPAMPKAK